MDKEKDIRRLFLVLKAVCPWPDLPKGRILEEKDRHLTLIFFGDFDLKVITSTLKNIPDPSFSVGLSAKFDEIAFLPKKKPNVAAWHVDFFEKEKFFCFLQTFKEYLKKCDILPKEKYTEFIPHVTIARKPFSFDEWEASFTELPVYFESFHLFESLGNLSYTTHWDFSFAPPFKEIEHTADLAFNIFAEDLNQLLINSQMALSFSCPDFIRFISREDKVKSLEDIIYLLNKDISNMDISIGSPFKAVSYTGGIKKTEKNILMWEMIVDV
jgi:2'-5' RNA ligase